MKLKTALLATALTSVAFAASAQEVTVMSWGGSYTKSQVEAYHKPFTSETGIAINSVDSDNPATPIKAQVEAGNVTVDVADVEFSDAVRLCDEGLLEEIDLSHAAQQHLTAHLQQTTSSKARFRIAQLRTSFGPLFLRITKTTTQQHLTALMTSSTQLASQASAACASLQKQHLRWL